MQGEILANGMKAKAQALRGGDMVELKLDTPLRRPRSGTPLSLMELCKRLNHLDNSVATKQEYIYPTSFHNRCHVNISPAYHGVNPRA